jgi:hypothetical protein
MVTMATVRGGVGWMVGMRMRRWRRIVMRTGREEAEEVEEGAGAGMVVAMDMVVGMVVVGMVKASGSMTRTAVGKVQGATVRR